MQAINFLTDWINYLLIIIPAGAGTMITYQAVRKSFSDDQGTIDDANYKIRQTIRGAIIGVSISGFITLVKTFFM